MQLYATRSSSSWGIGDLADLRAVRTWAEQLGAGFVLVNPLHAVAPTLPQEASPYLPATRRWRNPLYLRVDEVPGADAVDLAGPTAAGRGLTGQPLIDRDAVWQLKRRVLEQVFAARTGAAGAAGAAGADGFDGWRAEQGSSLQDHATWCALADTYGPDWHDWPAALRRPDGPAVARFAAEHADAVAFHAWLQWAVDDQLARASGDLTVVQDLPIGVAGGGADAWAWQDLLADGVQVGAPPDVFNATGQAWGSPPLIPWRVRADGYEAFVQSVRGTIAGAGGLRIDHVMGLFRLWWVPPGGSAVDGAYVRYPSDDLLDIVALESHRAGAVVVGEDLGTVEPGVRETLAERGLLSYRLLWFEDDDPARWPETSMAAVTTHDLPTVAGLWSGADLAEQLALGTGDDDEELTTGREQLRSRLSGPAGLAADAAIRRGGAGCAPAAGARAVDPRDRDPRGRGGTGTPPQHARHHRSAELVPAAAGARRRPAEPPVGPGGHRPAACRGVTADRCRGGWRPRDPRHLRRPRRLSRSRGRGGLLRRAGWFAGAPGGRGRRRRHPVRGHLQPWHRHRGRAAGRRGHAWRSCRRGRPARRRRRGSRVRSLDDAADLRPRPGAQRAVGRGRRDRGVPARPRREHPAVGARRRPRRGHRALGGVRPRDRRAARRGGGRAC